MREDLFLCPLMIVAVRVDQLCHLKLSSETYDLPHAFDTKLELRFLYLFFLKKKIQQNSVLLTIATTIK